MEIIVMEVKEVKVIQIRLSQREAVNLSVALDDVIEKSEGDIEDTSLDFIKRMKEEMESSSAIPDESDVED